MAPIAFRIKSRLMRHSRLFASLPVPSPIIHPLHPVALPAPVSDWLFSGWYMCEVWWLRMTSDSGVRSHVVTFQLYHRVLPRGGRYVTSLCLSFLIFKMGLIISPTKVVVSIKPVSTWQALRLVPDTYKHSIIVTLGLLWVWWLYICCLFLPEILSSTFT